jgi:hypothetical protein
MADHVKRPLLPLFPEPILQVRHGQRCASGVFRDRMLKGAQDMAVDSASFFIAKTLSTEEAVYRFSIGRE